MVIRTVLISWILILCLYNLTYGQELKPGDTIEIKVKGQEKLNSVLILDKEGNIAFPLIGAINARGKTPLQLQDEITDKLSLYIKRPKVTVVTEKAAFVSDTGVLTTLVFTLQYADAGLLLKAVQGVVSDKGSVNADESTNSLIITDIPSNLSRIDEVIKQLDVFGEEMRQVLIEARIVEVTTSKDEEIGAKWFVERVGGKKLAGSFDKEFNLPPLPTEIINDTLKEDTLVERRSPLPNIGLTTLAEGGSFFYGKLIRDRELDILLNALVTDGKAVMLAKPKIVVENSREAKIEILTEFPYRELQRVTSGAGDEIFTTKFLNIGVVLKVTPFIRKDNVINMNIEPEVSFVQGKTDDIPIRTTRKTTTRVNVEDGRTLIIGGLLQDKETKSVRKVPILGDIPLLGLLFSFKDEKKQKTELMVFITPHILPKESSVQVTGKK